MVAFLVDEHCVLDIQTLVLLFDESVEFGVSFDMLAVID